MGHNVKNLCLNRAKWAAYFHNLCHKKAKIEHSLTRHSLRPYMNCRTTYFLHKSLEIIHQLVPLLIMLSLLVWIIIHTTLLVVMSLPHLELRGKVSTLGRKCYPVCIVCLWLMFWSMHQKTGLCSITSMDS